MTLARIVLSLATLSLLPGCFESETCNGDVEVACDDDGCYCAAGDAAGDECVEDPSSADDCEVVCCEEDPLAEALSD